MSSSSSGGGSDGGGGGTVGPPIATVEVDASKPGQAVPSNYVGLSVEWSQVLAYLADKTGAPKAPTLQLLHNFDADGHRVDLRIGGNSSDHAWWNPTGLPRPAGVTVDVTPAFLSAFSAIHKDTGALFILGLNLALNDPDAAAALVKAALAAMPAKAVSAFEIGNEPDLYAHNGDRPTTYKFADYQTDLDSYFTKLVPAAAGAAPFAAPAWSGLSETGSFDALLQHEKGRIGLVTMHRYPFNVCNKMPGDPTYPKPTDLLTDKATTDIGKAYAPMVATAGKAGLSFRMGEMNSVACGGAPGVSDSFASALWSIDVLFELAEDGGIGVNLHTPGAYAVFAYTDAGLSVRPLYYGLRFFSMATAQDGQLLPAKVTSTSRVRAWATKGKDGAVRVALLNEDAAATGVVHLAVGGAGSSAQVARLTAPSLTAKTGLSLAGQTFDGSTDGRAIGKLSTEEVRASGAGEYDISLPALSGAIVSIGP